MTMPFSGAARLADDTRRRFLTEIASRVPLERLEEVHLFTPIRQGGTETGVAVVVARREPVAAPQCDPTEDAAGPVEDVVEPPTAQPNRHTIFTARYRLTIKGAERGRWMFDCVEEADAPLVTVAAVVRGVQRRAGDAADPDRLDVDALARALGAAPPEPA